MQIVNFRRAEGPRGGAIARFDVELSPQVRLLHWVLKRSLSGEARAFPPTVRHVGGDGAAARLAPELFGSIQSEASRMYSSGNGGRSPHDVT
jgi:hypothetical protein